MCIAAGCDHLKNIRGIGIKRAKEMVTQGEFLDKLTGLANSPTNYVNVVENCLAPLHPWTDTPSNDDIKACGQYPMNLCLTKLTT